MSRGTESGFWWRPLAAAAAALSVAVLTPAAAVMASGDPVLTRATQVGPPPGSHVPQGTGLYAIDCAAGGFCAAAGNYEQRNGSVQPMAAARYRGRWQKAAALLLPANAGAQPYGQVNGIACTAPGTCVAVGNYTYNPAHDVGPFIASEVRGRWARAFAPKLPANAVATPSARLAAVACTRTGFCAAVGSYRDSAGRLEAMTLTKPARGRWMQAAEIPPPASAAASGPGAVMTGLACTGPGSCVAVGSYSAGAGQQAAMGAVEVKGVWRRAAEIAAPPGAVPSPLTAITSISCAPGGSCLGVGHYAVTATRDRAMTVTESKGRFGRAAAVLAVPPGAAAKPGTALSSVSCPRVSRCVAAGVATNSSGHYVAMYVTGSSGHWRAAFAPQPRGVAAANHQQSSLFSVSCAGPEDCMAAGYYNDNSGGYSAEVAAADFD